jgi:hypothetical protein
MARTSRTLTIGPFALRLDGLDEELALGLEHRYGPFLSGPSEGRPSASIVIGPTSAGQGLLPPPDPGERYRIEPLSGSRRGVVSYGFTATDRGEGAWELALAPGSSEPAERRVENGLRFVTACLALDAGGLALHAAGVLVDGRAFLFAGPSRAGKSTAVRRSHPAQTLGDDFGVLLPVGALWHALAVPFDNAERIEATAPRGAFPLARVLRVHQAERTWIQELSPLAAAASLAAVAAFPWAAPDMGPALAERVDRLAGVGLFAHLYFHRDAELWELLAAHP